MTLHRGSRGPIALLAAVLGLAPTLLPLPAAAVVIVGGLQQISFGASNSFGASLSDDGSRLAFYSASNLTGGNADGNFEVFVFERGIGTTRQVTDLPGGIFVGGNQSPRISGDGSRIVYQQFILNAGFADFQTFTNHLGTGVTTAVTPRNPFFEQAVINGDGSRIAVQTDNTGVRLFDTGTNSLGGVAVGGNGQNLSLSGDGTRLVRGVFSGAVTLVDLDTSASTTLVPAGAGPNVRPVISADGRTVAFSGTFDPLGTNADGSAEIFLVDTQTGLLRQLTRATGGSSDEPSLSRDGSRVAFSSTADLLGTNPDGSTEVFVFDVLEGSLIQVTDRPAGVFQASFEAELSADGRWLAFSSLANLTGTNGDSASNIFLASLSPQIDAAVPLPGTASLLLLAAVSGGFVSRRRSGARAAPR